MRPLQSSEPLTKNGPKASQLVSTVISVSSAGENDSAVTSTTSLAQWSTTSSGLSPSSSSGDLSLRTDDVTRNGKAYLDSRIDSPLELPDIGIATSQSLRSNHKTRFQHPAGPDLKSRGLTRSVSSSNVEPTQDQTLSMETRKPLAHQGLDSMDQVPAPTLQHRGSANLPRNVLKYLKLRTKRSWTLGDTAQDR